MASPTRQPANAATSAASSGSEPKIAVAGASGYAGGELARLLLHHPRVTRSVLFLSREEGGSDRTSLLSELHPYLASPSRQTDQVHSFHWELLADQGVDILMLATPHEQSREWVPIALERGMRVIDLSGAWRLHVPANHAVYKLRDKDEAAAYLIQSESVYGCPELHRDAIPSARVTANPGCYATSVILALAPLVAEQAIDLDRGIVCDAKSGVSGAGKAATAKTHFMYAADNLSAYSVFGHRHIGELLEQLHLTAEQIRFTPHLLPIPRGILSTMYLRLKHATDLRSVYRIYESFFAGSPLIRLHQPGNLPQIQHVVRTNFCDLGIDLSPDGRDLLLVSCLDNLLKGAAGQAVQNLNLMCGWGEAEGLL